MDLFPRRSKVPKKSIHRGKSNKIHKSTVVFFQTFKKTFEQCKSSYMFKSVSLKGGRKTCKHVNQSPIVSGFPPKQTLEHEQVPMNKNE